MTTHIGKDLGNVNEKAQNQIISLICKEKIKGVHCLIGHPSEGPFEKSYKNQKDSKG